ncbi:MAG: penicillin acylase family protein [Bacteroidota bacterium]
MNSHQPLEGWYSWYEAHLISDEGLNILGGTFPGGVTIFHGVNEHLGWAHTVNHVDLSDVYQLEMHPENPLQYRYDDQWLTLDEKVYRAKLNLFAGIKIPIKRKVYQSIYGPTFKTDQSFFAWRYVVAQDIRAVEQWYRMNKAKNFEQFKAALEMQAIPSTNIVYADRNDNIFFISNAKVPVRDTNYVWREVVPGNTSATLWDSYYPLDSLPQVLNPASGYVYNTNNTPFSSSSETFNPAEKDLNFTMSYQRPDMENSRSIRFQELIEQYDSLSYEDFKRIKFDRQYGDEIQTREMLNLDILFHIEAQQYPEYADLIEKLSTWNRQFDIENTTAPLFIYMVQKLIGDLRDQDRYCWRCTIAEEDIIKVLAKTKDYFIEKYGGYEVALGDFQRHTRGEISLPLGGGPDVLAAMHSQEQEDGTFRGMAGESYIELVRFSDEGVEIETVHAYGSSAEPDSPHYTDQMELFVKQQLKPMTLDKNKVLEQAKSLYSPKKVIK